MNSELKITPRPATLTVDELRKKLRHLASILAESRYDGIVFENEGTMRWLTGIKHQLGDIAPSAISPVNALVKVIGRNRFRISIVSKPFEMPRLKDEIPGILKLIPEFEYEFLTSMPELPSTILVPGKDDYQSELGRIIRPLLDGFADNQFTKLDWLSKMTMKVLVETAYQLKLGMDGLEVRGLLLHNLARFGIDANLALISLSGQERHLHPIASVNYIVEEGKWLKLVVGTRYAEQIVSQSLMVKLGGELAEHEQIVYHALQDAALEYADCYRVEVAEGDIHSEMCQRFQKIENRYGLNGFAASAVLHHPGGGTSPLGNRDRMLGSVGTRTLSPWTQFAINPVDTLLGFKVELQGIVMPEGKPPFILDMGEFAEDLGFREITTDNGTRAKVPELLII